VWTKWAKALKEIHMSNQILIALIGVAVSVSAASADITTTLNLPYAYTDAAFGTDAHVFINQTVGGRSGVSTLDAGSNPFSYASVWGYAGSGYTAASNFGMQSSADQGSNPSGWANGAGALLADVVGAGFDYYLNSGSLSGGIRLSIYVYSPASAPGDAGFLQFDLDSSLPGQSAGQWYSTGNYLAAGSAINSAFYVTAYGNPAFSGRKTFQEILGLLGGWNVQVIGIMNGRGNVISIDNFAVTSVPAPGALALLGVAGLAGGRRRRA